MSEVNQPVTPQAPATPAATPEASPLEKVYQAYNIEDTASSFQPQTPAAPAQQPVQSQPAPKVPDAFDPNFGAHQEALVKNVSSLHDTVSKTLHEINAMKMDAIRQRTESDIKSAASLIAEKAGIKPKVAEVAMEVKAREDARFRAIWNNRQSNPKAYNAALEALAMEAAQEYAVKQDPQLAENQRAMNASRNQMATTQKQTQNDEYAAMSPAERQARIQQLIRRG